jgi:hypothetical protein
MFAVSGLQLGYVPSVSDLVLEDGDGGIQIHEKRFHLCLARQGVGGLKILVNLVVAAALERLVGHSVDIFRYRREERKVDAKVRCERNVAYRTETEKYCGRYV